MNETTRNGMVEEHDRYFRASVGQSWQALVAPVPGDAPAGHPAAQDEDYRRIRHERTEEDPSLPQGAWERELKRADWRAVGELSAQALATRSKDLQLVAWLSESLLMRSGFQALAPCIALLEALVRDYGRSLHPVDPEHAQNLWQWIAFKLQPAVRKVPLTATGGERDYAWNDWERAQRNEQVRASLGRQHEDEIEGATLADVAAALACTPGDRIAFLHQCLVDGLRGLAALDTARAGRTTSTCRRSIRCATCWSRSTCCSRPKRAVAAWSPCPKRRPPMRTRTTCRTRRWPARADRIAARCTPRSPTSRTCSNRSNRTARCRTSSAAQWPGAGSTRRSSTTRCSCAAAARSTSSNCWG